MESSFKSFNSNIDDFEIEHIDLDIISEEPDKQNIDLDVISEEPDKYQSEGNYKHQKLSIIEEEDSIGELESCF